MSDRGIEYIRSLVGPRQQAPNDAAIQFRCPSGHTWESVLGGYCPICGELFGLPRPVGFGEVPHRQMGE